MFNRKLLAFNLLITVTTLVAIISLFVFSFWNFGVSFRPDAVMIERLIGNNGGITQGENSLNVDLSQFTDDIDIKLEIDIKPSGLIRAMTAPNNTKRVAVVFKPALEDLKTQAKDITVSFIKVAIKVGVEVMVDTLQDELGANAADKLSNLDLSGLGPVIDQILSNEMTKGDAKANLLAYAIKTVGSLDISYEEKTAVLAHVDDDIVKALDQLLDELTDDKGCISSETLVDKVLLVFVGSDDNDSNTDEPIDRLIASLSEIRALVYIIFALAGLWALTIIPWIVLLIFATVHAIRMINGPSLGYAMAFGWLAWGVLWLLPAVLFVLAPRIMDSTNLGDVIFGDMVQFRVGALGPTISAICAVVLVLFTIFGYNRAKRESQIT